MLAGTATALSFAIIFLGSVWAVTRFSVAWGEFLWMQRAFDEPFYFWQLANGDIAVDNRLFSKLLGAALLNFGASFDWMAEAYAFVMPPLVFAGALLLARTWESHAIKRLVWALLLILSFDLLSGSSFVVFGDPPPATVLANLLGEPGLLKSDLMTFFIFLRRPEQQSSWLILFPYLAGLIGSFTTWRPGLYRIVCLVTPLLAIVYINVAVIALMVFGMLSIVSALIYRRPLAFEFASSLVATVLAFAAVFLGTSTDGVADRGLFLTHLPFVRPSLAFSLLGLAILAFQVRTHWNTAAPRHWVALVCLAVPLITLNQQILTGRAVLPQNWELSGNYICVVIGFAMLMARQGDGGAARPSLVKQAGLVCLWLGLLAIFIRGQLLNEAQYGPANAQSVAYAKVYRAAEGKIGRIDLVVLPHLWDELLFVTRAPRGATVLGGYNWLIANWPPGWGSGDSFEAHAMKAKANFDVGFETLARRGVTPEQFRASMDAEIRSGSCWPMLMYFFALQDCWPTFSNYTSSGTKRLPSAIGPLATMYDQYRSAAALSGAQRRILVIVPEPLHPDDDPRAFRHALVASFETTIRGDPVRAYAYLQTLP